MRLEELVPSRETCERLKEAGFTQECQFGWVLATPLDERAEIIHWAEANQYLNRRGIYVCAAPTFAEIAERLPALASVFQIHEGSWWHATTATLPVLKANAPTATEAAALLWLALNAKETA